MLFFLLFERLIHVSGNFEWANNGGLVAENIGVERQCLFMCNFDEIDFAIFAILIREGPLWAD